MTEKIPLPLPPRHPEGTPGMATKNTLQIPLADQSRDSFEGTGQQSDDMLGDGSKQYDLLSEHISVSPNEERILEYIYRNLHEKIALSELRSGIGWKKLLILAQQTAEDLYKNYHITDSDALFNGVRPVHDHLNPANNEEFESLFLAKIKEKLFTLHHLSSGEVIHLGEADIKDYPERHHPSPEQQATQPPTAPNTTEDFTSEGKKRRETVERAKSDAEKDFRRLKKRSIALLLKNNIPHDTEDEYYKSLYHHFLGKKYEEWLRSRMTPLMKENFVKTWQQYESDIDSLNNPQAGIEECKRLIEIFTEQLTNVGQNFAIFILPLLEKKKESLEEKGLEEISIPDDYTDEIPTETKTRPLQVNFGNPFGDPTGNTPKPLIPVSRDPYEDAREGVRRLFEEFSPEFPGNGNAPFNNTLNTQKDRLQEALGTTTSRPFSMGKDDYQKLGFFDRISDTLGRFGKSVALFLGIGSFFYGGIKKLEEDYQRIQDARSEDTGTQEKAPSREIPPFTPEEFLTPKTPSSESVRHEPHPDIYQVSAGDNLWGIVKNLMQEHRVTFATPKEEISFIITCIRYLKDLNPHLEHSPLQAQTQLNITGLGEYIESFSPEENLTTSTGETLGSSEEQEIVSEEDESSIPQTTSGYRERDAAIRKLLEQAHLSPLEGSTEYRFALSKGETIWTTARTLALSGGLRGTTAQTNCLTAIILQESGITPRQALSLKAQGERGFDPEKHSFVITETLTQAIHDLAKGKTPQTVARSCGVEDRYRKLQQ